MYPLYFGDFNSSAGNSNNPEKSPESGQSLMGNAYKFFWTANRASRSENLEVQNSKFTASVQGLVSNNLVNGNLVQDVREIDFEKTKGKIFNIKNIKTNNGASSEDLTGQVVLGRENVLKINYPGTAGTKDFRVELNCGSADFSDTKKYLTFDLYNESKGVGGSTFIAIKDTSGNQMAGWAKFYGTEYYDNTINSKEDKSWQKIMVDLDELKQNNNNAEHGTYNPEKVNFNSIQSIYIGYWGTGGGVFIDKSSIKFLNDIVEKENTKTVEVPYFNSEFLTDYNVGTTTDKYGFPFKKREKTVTSVDGSKNVATNYYVFSSGKSGYQINNSAVNDVVRINENTNNLDYWFDESDNGSQTVKDMNGKEAGFGGTGINEPGFFPFNVPSEGGKLAAPNSNSEDGLNYGFGAKIQINFKLTKDGTITTNGVKLPLEFNFKGDDDVWVYVDDQLELDMGGGHSQTEGNINFATGKATVKNVVDGKITSNSLLQPVITKSTELRLPNDYYINGDPTQGYDTDKIHSLTLFYMERGMVESNLYMDFNFIPSENELIVEKEVDISSVNSELETKTKEIANNIDFKFNLSENEIKKQNLNYMLDINGALTDKIMDKEKFYLKHTNIATFYNKFQEGTKVTVKEEEDSRFTTTWITKDISHKNNHIVLAQGEGNVAQSFDIPYNSFLYEKYIYYAKFTNKINVGNLSIEKKVDGFIEKDKTFKFKLTINSILGQEVTPIIYAGDYYVGDQVRKTIIDNNVNVIEIKAGEKAEIKGLPYGTKYTIEEIEAEGYEILSSQLNGIDSDSGNKSQISATIDKDMDSHNIEYINKKTVGNLIIKKVDMSNEGITLSGAKFKIEKLSKDEVGNEIVDSSFDAIIKVTDEKGEIVLENLPYGDYLITEIEAPEGYELLKEPIKVTVENIDENNNTVEIKVYNKKSYILPEAGGKGVKGITLIGTIMIFSALIGYKKLSNKKKLEK